MLWAKLYTGSGLLVVVRSTHRDNGGKVQSRLCRFLVVHGNYAERQRSDALSSRTWPNRCVGTRGAETRERESCPSVRERDNSCVVEWSFAVQVPTPPGWAQDRIAAVRVRGEELERGPPTDNRGDPFGGRPPPCVVCVGGERRQNMERRTWG